MSTLTTTFSTPLSRRPAIRRAVVLGSGALKIGEAGEFDYSGSQALKALREEGVHTILINPNIATVQTSEGVADRVYFLPVTPEFVAQVLEKEKPDGLLISFGGQTALNCGIELYRSGVLERLGIPILGTPVETVLDTEDRERFVRRLTDMGVKTPRSIAACSVSAALAAGGELGFPVIVRAAFSLGGLGSGFCAGETELAERAAHALAYANQVLVEESLKGWKEIEYEVVRDAFDNCITVCNMENFDPLGIHTGESIVVAPSQTLTNNEYHKLRELSVTVIRRLGVVGECNIQYALDPQSEDYRVIEVNARLSRSSALASKAAGYPLAFIAAKLALGYGLHELKNSVTGTTTACFEPALDYIACKIPRWDLNKFKGVSHLIGSSMKSVGEVMAIGRTFEEAIQKGLRMIGQGMHGFTGNRQLHFDSIRDELEHPTDRRVFAIAAALDAEMPVEEIHALTRIDRWFLEKLQGIVGMSRELSACDSLEAAPPLLLRQAKQAGFSDFQLARLILKSPDESMEDDWLKVRRFRQNLGLVPRVKQIDTLAAEYPAITNYLYMTYNGDSHDLNFEKDGQSVIVLGSGAYRIGSSVEFDWCAVSSLRAISAAGLRSVMINYNPETVSTDFDNCNRLFFEELSLERVLDIIELEQPKGVIVAMGGQIPNNLAFRLHKLGVPVLGTAPESIDRAEDRQKFSLLLDQLNVDQPRWKELNSLQAVQDFISEVGYPVLIRPSYVLSGAAMNVVSNHAELKEFFTLAAEVSKQHPVVATEFIREAKELEIDAVADHGEILVYAISEHVEFAGVHSGDATIVFPAQKIYMETMRRVKRISREIARGLNITGPFNIQFLARDNAIRVIECNLRASRSFPFVSKILKCDFIRLATHAMLGLPVEKPEKSLFDLDYIGVKAPQFSFSRLWNADPVLGVEMASTGEVGCIGDSYYEAVLKAMLSVGHRIPQKNILLSTGPLRSKVALLDAIRLLDQKGFVLFATSGTADFLKKHGIRSQPLHWPDENQKPNVMDYLRNRKIDLAVNIPKNLSQGELRNDYLIRRAAVDFNIPLITDARLADAFITAFCQLEPAELAITAWDEYH